MSMGCELHLRSQQAEVKSKSIVTGNDGKIKHTQRPEVVGNNIYGYVKLKTLSLSHDLRSSSRFRNALTSSCYVGPQFFYTGTNR